MTKAYRASVFDADLLPFTKIDTRSYSDRLTALIPEGLHVTLYSGFIELMSNV
jgi:hypothetical protein